MATIYEAKTNVHIPALKCSYQKGTRFTLDNDKIVIGDNEFPVCNEFKILIKCGSIKELTEKEASKPEKVSTPNVIKVPERQKMKVEMAENLTKPLTSETQEEEKEIVESFNTDQEDTKTIRGMKVVNENTSKIKTETEKTPKKEIDPEQTAKIEATKKARIAAAEKARAALAAQKAKAKENVETQEQK